MTIYDHLRNAEAELLAAAGKDAPAEIRTALYDLLYSLADLRGNMPKGDLPPGTIKVSGAIDPEYVTYLTSHELRNNLGF